jgi:hypothetical protein
VGVILLLAVGLPVLLLGGCAAVVIALSSSTPDRVVVQPDPPVAKQPLQEPVVTDAPPAQDVEETQTAEQPSSAKVGGTITLQGIKPTLKVAVTLNRFVSSATPAHDFMKPKAGNRFVAVQLTLANQGQDVYGDSPSNGALVIDEQGQQYRSTLYEVREGPSFGGSATINTGDSRKGMIVFEVPEGVKLAKFQFALDSGIARQKGEWALS